MALSAAHGRRAGGMRVCIHSGIMRVCAAFMQHTCTVGEAGGCSVVRDEAHVCTHMWAGQCTCACVNLHLSGTVYAHAEISAL